MENGMPRALNPNLNEDGSLRVCELIDFETGGWDVDKIRGFFNEGEV